MEGSICCTVRSMMCLPRSREDRNAASFSLMISLICPRIRRRVNHNISGSSSAQPCSVSSKHINQPFLFCTYPSQHGSNALLNSTSHCASCHHSCQGNIDHPCGESFRLTNVPFWVLISVTQLQLYVWNSQKSCCQWKQAGSLALNHHSTLDKGYPGKDRLYLHSTKKATVAFLEQQLPYTGHSVPGKDLVELSHGNLPQILLVLSTSQPTHENMVMEEATQTPPAKSQGQADFWP